MSRKRIVLFVEGVGDAGAVPALVKKLLTERDAWRVLTLDENVFTIGGLHNVTGSKAPNWVNKLRAAAKRRDLGGVLLVLDGDTKKRVRMDETSDGEPFCAARVALCLAERARAAGAGSLFSVACVFALQEFESWLLAGIDSLRGKPLPDGRAGIRAEAKPDDVDTDTHPRDAKGRLNHHMAHGYKPSTDQELLASMVTLESIRESAPRSFRRLEHAVEELCNAIRTGEHLVSPSPACSTAPPDDCH